MTAEAELAGFIAKFAPEMKDRIRGCRGKLQARYPDAVQLVYDNYNFLVMGFGPTRRPSDAIVSLAAHRRGVNLCFLQSPDDLERPDVGVLLDAALERAATPMQAAVGPDVIIRSVSARQRPRR